MIQTGKKDCPKCEGHSVGKILHCDQCDNSGYITVSMDTDAYDADYFLRGKETGKSLYENYRWMPDLTLPMARTMIQHLGVEKTDTVLDFGCARGYTVKAFRQLGYSASGFDISKWAIDNCDEDVAAFLTCGQLPNKFGYDWIIAKDVLEHVTEVSKTIVHIMDLTTKGVFAVVPLSAVDGGKYVVRSYEEDVTHVHRLTLSSWMHLFMRPGWSVECSYRVKGVKDNYAEYAKGNGFITARRVDA